MLPCIAQGSSLQLAAVLGSCGGNVARWCEELEQLQEHLAFWRFACQGCVVISAFDTMHHDQVSGVCSLADCAPPCLLLQLGPVYEHWRTSTSTSSQD